MKVALIDVNFDVSSTGKLLRNLQKYGIEQGHEVHAYYGRGSKVRQSNVHKFGFELETYIHALLARLTGLNGYFSLFSTLRLLYFLKKVKPDVVNIVEPHAYFLNTGMLIKYLKKNKVKSFLTVVSEYMYTGKCGHAKNCLNYQNFCHSCPQIREYPKSLFFDFTRFMHNDKLRWYRDWDVHVIVPSEWSENRLKLSILNTKLVSKIRFGLDTSIFNHNNTDFSYELNGLKKQKYFLSVFGNLSDKNKGFSWIEKIAERFVSISDVQFLVIGKVNGISSKLNNIRLLGPIVDQKVMSGFYRNAIATIVVSQYETFSMVSQESIACGTPVIGFNVGGMSDALSGYVNHLVDYGSDELFNVVEKFIFSPNGYRIFPKLDDLDFNNMAREYFQLYEEI